MDEESTIQDAEVVETPAPPQPTFDINAFNATLEIVRRRILLIEQAQKELKKLKEMYNDIFVNDATYNETDKVVKEAMKKRKDVQSQLTKQPAAQQTLGKIKDLKDQLKENQESLSQELIEYYKTSGVTEIEDADGNVQEFQIVVKLKPKKKA